MAPTGKLVPLGVLFEQLCNTPLPLINIDGATGEKDRWRYDASLLTSFRLATSIGLTLDLPDGPIIQ